MHCRPNLVWLFVGAFFFLGMPTVTSGQQNKVDLKKVIVVGAGISGLAAAQKLNEKGFDVTVLEGRNRIGGRIWTDRSFGGQALDLGASWIHGTKRNPIARIAKQQKIQTSKTNYENGIVFIDGKEITEEKAALHQKFTERVSGAILSLTLRGKRKSVQDLADSVAERKEFSQLSKREIDFILNTEIEHEFAADSKELSTAGVMEGEAFFGSDVIFPKGYDQIISFLRNGIDVRLGQKVTGINYEGSQIVVTTEKGEAFKANRVIVTVPLGVLKKQVIKFTPELPEEKQKAIADLGMGILNKLYLQFPNNFWDKKEPTELINIIPKKKGRWGEWLNIAFYTKKPILLGFNAGEYGLEIEKRTDKQIVDDAMSVLRETYGMNIPEPKKWLVTRWSKDPFSYGSYSFAKSGRCVWARRTLGDSVKKKVFFAGEATSVDYPGTVHGAYLSGLREAEKVIKSHKK